MKFLASLLLALLPFAALAHDPCVTNVIVEYYGYSSGVCSSDFTFDPSCDTTNWTQGGNSFFQGGACWLSSSCTNDGTCATLEIHIDTQASRPEQVGSITIQCYDGSSSSAYINVPILTYGAKFIFCYSCPPCHVTVTPIEWYLYDDCGS